MTNHESTWPTRTATVQPLPEHQSKSPTTNAGATQRTRTTRVCVIVTSTSCGRCHVIIAVPLQRKHVIVTRSLLRYHCSIVAVKPLQRKHVDVTRSLKRELHYMREITHDNINRCATIHTAVDTYTTTVSCNSYDDSCKL